MDSHDLYRRHLKHVKRLLRRFGVRASELDDAVQDSFERIHRLIGEFEGRAKLETWIHAICWRVAAEYRRAGRRRLLGKNDELRVEEDVELIPIEELQAGLATLDQSDRELLVLHTIGEISISALSEMTGSARLTIRRRLEGARAIMERRVDHAAGSVAGLSSPAIQPATALRRFDEQSLLRLAEHANHREYICRDYGFSRIGNMVITIWTGSLDITTWAVCTKLTLAAAELSSGGFTHLSVIDQTSSLPDLEGWQILTFMMAKTGPRLRAVAFVPLSHELRVKAPAITNSAVFMSQQDINIRYFGQAIPAVDWLVRHTPGASLATVLTHYQRMRRTIEAYSNPISYTIQADR